MALDAVDRKNVAQAMREVAQVNFMEPRRAGLYALEAERYGHCGSEALLLTCRQDYQVYFTRVRCRSRLCEPCGVATYRPIADRLADLIKAMMVCKRRGFFCSLLTLTVTTKRWGDRLPNRSEVDRIYRESGQFFRLFAGKFVGRRSKSGRITQDRKRFLGAGGIATLEVGTDNSNLHIHAVVFMPYVHKSVLVREWQKITGDSYIVDIHSERNPGRIARYVLKYIVKPPRGDSYRRLAEWGYLIKGVRRLRTFGIFYNHLKFPSKLRKQKCRCPLCGSRLYPDRIVPQSELGPQALNLWQLIFAAEKGVDLWIRGLGGFFLKSAPGQTDGRLAQVIA